ncbi:MAG: DUF480 domain-containing protein [Mariniblastus sp.]
MNNSDETEPKLIDASAIIDTEANANEEPTKPKIQWQPLTRIQRRVAGVLIEKSKTTPDVYPMTINGIKTASNQKSNRSPQLDLREDQVEETLYELRHLGAVIEVHSGGRVPKFKHQLYEWLGVEKVELAVIAELMLRGEQSLGDLRARASRMDKIAGINELRPVIVSLLEKNLMVELTPAGRGQIVTHNLYQSDEIKRLRAEHGNYVSEPADNAPRRSAETANSEAPNHSAKEINSPSTQTDSPPNIAQPELTSNQISKLTAEVAELRQTVELLQQQIAEFKELLS